jgi:hypothetical protein
MIWAKPEKSPKLRFSFSLRLRLRYAHPCGSYPDLATGGRGSYPGKAGSPLSPRGRWSRPRATSARVRPEHTARATPRGARPSRPLQAGAAAAHVTSSRGALSTGRLRGWAAGWLCSRVRTTHPPVGHQAEQAAGRAIGRPPPGRALASSELLRAARGVQPSGSRQARCHAPSLSLSL